MSFASHDGASMTHGSDFLSKYAPGPLKPLLGGEAKNESGSELMLYQDVIEPIFERCCVQCHKEGKSKGKPQIEKDELTVIKWWINAGADHKSKLSDVKLPSEIESIVVRLLEMPDPVAEGTQDY